MVSPSPICLLPSFFFSLVLSSFLPSFPFQISIIFILFYSVCTGVLSESMSVHHSRAWYPQGPEEGLLELDVQTVVSHHESIEKLFQSFGKTHMTLTAEPSLLPSFILFNVRTLRYDLPVLSSVKPVILFQLPGS